MDYALQTDRLCKNYRHYHALNGLTMNVPCGSIYGFVGRNGAGKTTLIRLICGLQKPTSGTFTLDGVHSTQKDILNIRRRMGAVVETPSIYLGMSAEDNLKQQYRILGLPSYDGLRELLELVGLSDTGRKKAKDFSPGMRQRPCYGDIRCFHVAAGACDPYHEEAHRRQKQAAVKASDKEEQE